MINYKMSYPQGAELVAVIIFAIFACILLSFGLYHFFTQFSGKKSYSVTLNGERTYNDYPVSVFIDDFQRINIFVPNNMSQPYVIPLTHMIGQEASINSSNITYPIISQKSSSHNRTELLIIQVNANSTTPGQFEGLIMISERNNNNTHISIPITLRSNVMTFNAIIWILVGIFASFIFWEFIKANQKQRVKEKLKPFKEETTFDKINHPRVVENLVQRIKHERIYEYLDNRYKTGVVVGKIVFVDIMSIIFGIVLGLIGLLNNDYVSNILVMTPQSIVILLGTGLAIGSIKELVDKPD